MIGSIRPTVLFLAAACAFAVHAQADKELKGVVVTATKSAKDTADAPATVSVVTAQDIAERNVQSVDQALTLVPGAYATRAGGNEPSVMGTHVMLRGIPDYSRTLVLVDGQTLNDPYIGAVTWESVPAEIVDRIEVVPGPFSSLYGGSAMGGVINIMTKAPTKRSISLKGGVGSDAFRSGTLVYQDRIGSVGLVVDYAKKRSDGYVSTDVVVKPSGAGGAAVTGARATTNASGETVYLIGDKGANGWSSENFGVKAYFDLSGDSRLTVGASQFVYTSSGRNRYNTYLRNAAGNPVSAGAVTVAGTGARLAVRERDFLTGPDSEIKEFNRYSAEYERKLGRGAEFRATLGYTDMPLYNNYFVLGSGATLAAGGSASRMLRPSSELSGSAQASLPIGERQLLVAGMSASRRMIDTVTYAVGDWRNAGATGPVQNRTSGEDTTYALYAQDEIQLSDRLMAYLGARYDAWSTEGFIEQLTAPAAKNVYDARRQTHLSPKLSLVWRPSEATTLRGSVGNAFHTPNLRDTFGWWTPTTGYSYIPNPDLKPETVTSWEVGAEQQFGRDTLLRATYFDNRLKDLIYRTQDDIAMTQGVANAGRARVKGIELELRRQIGAGLTAFANVTFNDPRITSNPAKAATEGKVMTNAPRKMANLGLQGAVGPWSGSLTGHYAGKVFTNDENKDTVSGVYGSYDGYFIADAKLSYKLGKQTTLSLAVNNLADREYYQSTRAQGRSYFAELALRF